MSQTKRELVLAAFDNKSADRVPVGFWHHFLADEIGANAFGNPAVVAQLIEGHKKWVSAFEPDLVKIMTDGFFRYDNAVIRNIKSVKDAAAIKPLGENSAWVQEQVAYAQQVTELFGKDLVLLYNLFGAPRYLDWTIPDYRVGDQLIGQLIREDKSGLKYILDVISEDVATLAKALIRDAKVDGIYLSVQNVPTPEVTKAIYEEVVAPGEKKILAAANSESSYNMLHICGYDGCRNDISWYEDYDVKAINFASYVEQVTLSAGKKVLGGRCVVGGFDNTVNGVLYKGSQSEIEAETAALLQGIGRTGVILGADCTIPRDISIDHLNWVRAVAK